jgi:hypothetical protein
MRDLIRLADQEVVARVELVAGRLTARVIAQ